MRRERIDSVSPPGLWKSKRIVVVMNFNHPLAGKTLNFDVEVVEIK